MPSASLLAAVRRYCDALDAERVAAAAALAACDPERDIGARVELQQAELELRAVASEEESRAKRGLPSLPDRIRHLIAMQKPAAEPEEEDYDDTESAYANGQEVAAWQLCVALEHELRK